MGRQKIVIPPSFELDILRLSFQGYTVKEIAYKLSKTKSHISKRIENVCNRLGCSGKAEAIYMLIAAEIIAPPPYKALPPAIEKTFAEGPV